MNSRNEQKNAFGVAAKAILEKFIYAKMLPHLIKGINQAHLENGSYEQIATHPKKSKNSTVWKLHLNFKYTL